MCHFLLFIISWELILISKILFSWSYIWAKCLLASRPIWAG
jgi:hypothetical protein